MSAIPFKINIVLLEFIINYWEKSKNFLIDPYSKHEYESIKKKTKVQKYKREYKIII